MRMERSSAPDGSVIETEQPDSAADLVPELIRIQAELSPNSTALIHGEGHLTYAELDHRGSLLAGYLRTRGVKPGASVAICLERSFEWIISALGIMRAGAAYVALDPAWPERRLRYAIEDSGAVLLFSRAPVLARLHMEQKGIDPWRDATAIAACGELRCEVPDPDRLAYLIYTSGSTGTPKGVEITHANLAHLTRWHRRAFQVTGCDRASHLAGLGFDAAAWEVWPNLAAGATLVLADECARGSAEAMKDWLVRERITLSFVPTLYAGTMMFMEWPPQSALRCLLTGGDTLQKSPPEGLPFQVVNNYGPTECTVVSTSTVLHSGVDVPSIGRAIRGATIYLVDEQEQLVPDGMPGEIYIGGGGVGRGYRNLNEATERSFLPDPFAGRAGARMFRTGDRGLRLPSGEIQFLGRFDRQVKIRGQRVELDEVSHVLMQHPDIAFASVALAPQDQSDEASLVGYVLPRADRTAALRVKELQEYLFTRLPDYMVPSRMLRLRKLPLSANGKIDLNLLAQLSESLPIDRKMPAEPLSPISETLLTMVRQLLGNNEMTADGNFFLEGGHSLLATQLLVRLQSAFGIQLSLGELFASPTVHELAGVVEKRLLDGIAAMTEEEATQQLAKDFGREQSCGD
jgi:amino acid adenylation domain-containing protein